MNHQTTRRHNPYAEDLIVEVVLCLWFRASLIFIKNCTTRCNTKQSIYYSASSLYMFRVSTTPISRSTQNCNYSLRYWSYFLCSYLPPTWSIWSCWGERNISADISSYNYSCIFYSESLFCNIDPDIGYSDGRFLNFD